MNAQPYPSLFDTNPTLDRKAESWNELQPSDLKLKKHRILFILLKHPLLRYDEIPPLYEKIYGEKIKESSVCGRLFELAGKKYVSTKNEKSNCEGKIMVTAYMITDDGIKFLHDENQLQT